MNENAVCCGAAFKDGMACPACEKHYVRGLDKKAAICAYLKNSHTGKSRAIHSRDLQRLFSIDGRTLRRKISGRRDIPSAAMRLAITMLTIKWKLTIPFAGSMDW